MKTDLCRNDFVAKAANGKWKNHTDLLKAIDYLDEVENAIVKYANFEIQANEYVQLVSKFDKHLYQCYYTGAQKTNPFNTNQNKAFSVWKELYWVPMVERLRKRLVEATGISFVLIQGEKKRVAVSVYKNGKLKFKDVDLGIGILHSDGYVIPVIAIECKGGHACATCHDGIWGQGIRMKKTFPNALQGFVTDNNISVGQNTPIEEYSDGIDFELIERGDNKKRGLKVYAPLLSNQLTLAEDKLFKKVSSMPEAHWKTTTLQPKPSGIGFRKQMDDHGSFFNW
jgi:hypothetical protein